MHLGKPIEKTVAGRIHLHPAQRKCFSDDHCANPSVECACQAVKGRTAGQETSGATSPEATTFGLVVHTSLAMAGGSYQPGDGDQHHCERSAGKFQCLLHQRVADPFPANRDPQICFVILMIFTIGLNEPQHFWVNWYLCLSIHGNYRARQARRVGANSAMHLRCFRPPKVA